MSHDQRYLSFVHLNPREMISKLCDLNQTQAMLHLNLA